MGPLCHRKYREAACPEIRAYFSFCPAITAAPRLHGRAATNMGAAARTVEEKKVREGMRGRRDEERTTERTSPSEKKRVDERVGDFGEKEIPFRIPRASLLISPHFYCTCRW